MSPGGRASGRPRGVAVVHDIPGRLRLRLPAHARAEGLPEAVSQLSGVVMSTWSPLTRGLLIRYRSDVIAPAAIARAVAEHAGVAEDEIVDLPGALATSNSGTPVAQTVVQAVSEVNQRVGRATRGVIDLAGLIPLALTAWAVAQIFRGRVAPLSWSSALWYAHGLFRDYNSPRPEQ